MFRQMESKSQMRRIAAFDTIAKKVGAGNQTVSAQCRRKRVGLASGDNASAGSVARAVLACGTYKAGMPTASDWIKNKCGLRLRVWE